MIRVMQSEVASDVPSPTVHPNVQKIVLLQSV